MIYLKKFQNHSEYEQYISQTGFIPNVSICTNQEDVHYMLVPKQYVDLDLPSGTLWAKCNIGANSETERGYYFTWGGTDGYPDASIKNFDYGDYELGNGGETAADMLKYNSTDGKTVLEKMDDSAYQYSYGLFRLPVEAEYQEILNTNYVTNAWVTNYNDTGVNGRLFTSKSNGNTLFFPACGIADNGSIDNVNVDGLYWSSTLSTENEINGNYLSFTSSYVAIMSSKRWHGQMVRGVLNNA